MKSALLEVLFRLYQRRFRSLRGWSFITNYCHGGTLSQLAGDPYNSPTVGLWLTNDGYQEFCGRFPAILRETITKDDELSARFGYPVGDLDGIKLMFMHYDTFDQAVAAWQRRVERINFNKLLFVCSVRDDQEAIGSDRPVPFGAGHLAHFRALPYPRVLLTKSLGQDEPFAVTPPPRYRVEDLHSWLPLARTLTTKYLRAITR